MGKPANVQEEWARVLLDAFAQAGVRDVVLSPGSRSTPFVLAAIAHPGLRCRDVLDERVAAFVALGQARATGRPSLLVCTSGTAAAHYFPAIVEAGVSHVPMIVLSADRPTALFAAGESQTIDQLKLFGDHVRFFAELGAPAEGDANLHALRRFAVQAVAIATGASPGPVHLNARAVRPLEPEPLETPEDHAHAAHAEALRARPVLAVHEPESRPSPRGLDALESEIRRAKRPLVVAGHGPLDPALARVVRLFASRSRIPVCAEAASQARFGGGDSALVLGQADALYRSPTARARLAPDLVVQLGGAPIAKGLSLLDAEREPRRVVIAPHGFPDPTSRASLLLHARPRTVLRVLAERFGRRAHADLDRAWVSALLDVEGEARRLRDELVASAGDALTEGALAKTVVSALPAGALLSLGNSLPIREVDGYADPGEVPLSVLSQRGASGIDGLVASLAGAAGATRKPAVLLVGDVSFLHDAGGLAALRTLDTPAVVVVVNNGGGRIFEQLPIGTRPPEVLRHFTTPHEAELGAAAALHRVTHVRVDTVSGLSEALGSALSRPSATVVEAVVPPHGAKAQNAELFRRVDAQVRARFEGAP